MPQSDFEHMKVNHSENFVDPLNREVHSQTIEGFGWVLKRKLRLKAAKIKIIFYRKAKGDKNDDEFFKSFVKDINN